MTAPVDVLAVTNTFSPKFMRTAFADMVNAYNSKSPLLFNEDGSPHRGNGWAGMFWRGFNGQQVGVWDAASKKTGSYPAWSAGVAVRAALARDGAK